MRSYEVAASVTQAASILAYERKDSDPVTRPLRIYTVDPSLPRVDGAIATIQVPYEPLLPGPKGYLFEVISAEAPPLDLESPRILIGNGLQPGVANPAFHQQMVYAVASSTYALFRSALGRLIAWGVDAPQPRRLGPRRLLLRPHVASEGANASYRAEGCEILFGHAPSRKLPGGIVFSCLSHDIIVHEVTHALIHGLRSRFTVPTNSDVLGFHEGLSDLVAVFHHFLYAEVLATQIRKSGPNVEHSELLTHIASEFGISAIGPASVRKAADAGGELHYAENLEPHAMGNVLVAAVFDAFIRIFQQKTERIRRLAGPQTPGFWSEDLVQLLAEKAARLARNFLEICIRAIDYCPPVDLSLGEYLRAIVTADFNLVPNDPWCYRETIVDCFARRGILPDGVIHLSEDSLLWRCPNRALPPIPNLSFSALSFNGDPSKPASAEGLYKQACALGDYITQPHICDEFGLMPAAPPDVGLPSIQSIRTSRRVGPNGQVLFDLVAEVTQRRIVTGANGSKAKLYGGSTILIGPRGEVRYVISKSVRKAARIDALLKFQAGSRFWELRDGHFRLTGYAITEVHKSWSRLEI
jgi:hypothetical protein